MKELERIIIDPNICHGKPCIKGTRIPVHIVLELIEAGYTFERIIKECYPQLIIEDLRACVKYAAWLIENEEIIPFKKAI